MVSYYCTSSVDDGRMCKSLWLTNFLFVEWNAPTVKFAILVATFRSRSSVHAPLYRTDQPIKMPTLLVYGEVDNVIPRG